MRLVLGLDDLEGLFNLDDSINDLFWFLFILQTNFFVCFTYRMNTTTALDLT